MESNLFLKRSNYGDTNDGGLDSGIESSNSGILHSEITKFDLRWKSFCFT